MTNDKLQIKNDKSFSLLPIPYSQLPFFHPST
jgi:hypothetical protein